jgi:hypothetical protein
VINSGDSMDETKFWKIIAKACKSDPDASDEWGEALQTELEEYDPEEILAWDRIFDRLAVEAYTVDLWGAAYTINGGASDDGFYYFRCWLIGMGQKVYEAALANPDSLADVVAPEVVAEAEIYGVAAEAWMAVTGLSEMDLLQREENKPRGEEWDFDDEDEIRRRFPRLAALYLE